MIMKIYNLESRDLMHCYLFLPLFLMPLTLYATTLPQELKVPGGIALVSVEARDDAPPTVTFDGARVAVVEHDGLATAVVGIPLNAHIGEQWLDMRWPSGKHVRQSFTVKPKEYETQYITIKDEREASPLPADLERIAKEQAISQKVLSTWSDDIPDFSFMHPVEAPISSAYGLRRFYNNELRSPHSGLDIAAPQGTPIRAPADAIVLQTGDNFFFNGNVVYLGHGESLITVYCHMSRIDVKSGQQVKQGDIIGLVGATGRATGPHLHWGVYLNGTPVDPNLFLVEGYPGSD
jgi:murein DD-endopeptidase MepM/ murein hydrolase activator NlpD